MKLPKQFQLFKYFVLPTVICPQEIFELNFDGKRFVAKEVIRHETGPKVVMNCAAYSNSKHTYLAAGQESHCQLYKVQITVENEPTKDAENEKGNFKM